MTVDDPLHCCQANTGPLKFAVFMESMKRCKDLVRILHIKTDAVVADEIDRLAIRIFHAEMNPDILCFGAVLEGIAEQIVQDNSEQLLFCINDHPPVNLNLRGRGISTKAALLQDFFSKQAQIELFPC